MLAPQLVVTSAEYVDFPLNRPACNRLQVRAHSHTKKLQLLALAIVGNSRNCGHSQVAKWLSIN